MASFNFEVDTNPMAHSVDTVRGHVTGVAAAVTAMEAAVIAAERQASKTICDNVDNGFYMLIKSQISQKSVAAYSEMQARQIAMFNLVKALNNVRRQMEADYNMISRRYAKLFNSLNKELETRIRELDRPAMKLADIRKAFIFDKLKDESSFVLSSAGEIAQFEQTALNGKLKQKTKETLKTLAVSVEDNESYTGKVKSILDDEASSGFYYIPAFYTSQDSFLNKDDHLETVWTAQSDVWQNTRPVVSSLHNDAGSMEWKPAAKEEKARVRKELLNICEREITGNERLSKEIMRLFDESSWEAL